jgi:AcrR family transcriptional regulator
MIVMHDAVSGRKATRERLLETACRLVRKEGIGRLTLDAVAQASGVSKGGLLYHFPAKEDLVAGMVQYLADRFQDRLEREERTEAAEMRDGSGRAPAQGRFVRSYIRSTFADANQLEEIGVALLAALAVNPRLLDPLREYQREWQARIEDDGLDPAMATVLRLAADGLWFADLFGLAPPQGELRDRVLEVLQRWAGMEQ